LCWFSSGKNIGSQGGGARSPSLYTNTRKKQKKKHNEENTETSSLKKKTGRVPPQRGSWLTPDARHSFTHSRKEQSQRQCTTSGIRGKTGNHFIKQTENTRTENTPQARPTNKQRPGVEKGKRNCQTRVTQTRGFVPRLTLRRFAKKSRLQSACW